MFSSLAGQYKKLIDESGQVRRYDAFDGSPYCEQVSEGRVRHLDLSVPQYGLPIYDWIVSLEVAEHIPPQFEAAFLDNLFRCEMNARKYMLILEMVRIPLQRLMRFISCSGVY